MNRIVYLGTGSPGGFKTHADFDSLDRLDGHHRLSQSAIELAIPLGMGPESKGNAIDSHFDDPAKRVTVLACPIDEGLDRRISFQIQSIQFALITDRAKFVERSLDWARFLRLRLRSHNQRL